MKENKSLKKMPQLTGNELAVFFSQFALLLGAGIAPMESLNILLKDTENANGRAILNTMHDSLAQGNKLNEAMHDAGVFPDYAVQLVAVGEESGQMDTVTEALGNYYEREENLRDSLRSAVSYPIIMIVMMFIVVIVLLSKVLPVFEQVFAELGSSMNGISGFLLDMGNQLGMYSTILACIFLVIAIVFLYFYGTEKGRVTFRKFLEVFPPTRDFSEQVAIGRFASGMGLTLSSGLDIMTSLTMSNRIVENRAVSERVDNCRKYVEQGDSLPEALDKAKVFSSVHNRMIAVGVKSGNVEAIMNRIARRYEYETDRKLYQTISIIEPTLVIVLAIVVGLILLSVIMPLMGIMASIG